MNVSERLTNCGLKFREKFSNSFHYQVLRLGKTLFTFPKEVFKNGVIKAMLNLTYRCDCDCDYCWCASYDKNPEEELSFLELKDVIDQIAGYPSLFTLLSFIGGEPLLREDIYQLVDYASRRGLFTEMETNGVYLSRDNILKLKDSRLSHLFVRIEGSTKDRHDSISRLDGCFEKATEGIKRCQDLKLPCSIFMNASREKIRDREIERVIDLGRALKVKSVRIIFPVLSGRLIRQEMSRLTPEEEEAVRRFLEPGFVYLESSDACFKQTQRICAATRREFFHISCYGEIQPCPFVPLSFGNLRREKLNDILKRMWGHDIFSNAYQDCLMNNTALRDRYIMGHNLEKVYRNIEV